MKKLLQLFCLFLLLVILFFSSAFFFIKENTPLQPADVLIVLGNPSNVDGSVTAVQRSRLDKAIAFYQRGLAKKLLFTGGAAWNDVVESETMRTYAIRQGIPADAILIETKSTNTGENVANCAQILEQHNYSSLIVVTSTLHTRRANFLFSQYPFKVQSVAAAYPPTYTLYRYALSIAGEYYGFMRYFIIGV